MDKKEFLARLKQADRLVNASKGKRLMHNPFKYIYAIGFRNLYYRFKPTEKTVKSPTFWGKEMHLALPASTDIFLTGSKAHESESRLASFLIENLQPKSFFLDVGAHYGFFSLLAAEIAQHGRVYSFEPSEGAFKILKSNTENLKNVEIFNLAVSNNSKRIEFYEFDNLYAEYNSTQIEQFKEEKWFKEGSVKKKKVDSISLSDFIADKNILPHIIKIDVEGFEDVVIEGLVKYLNSAEIKPLIVLEYLEPKRNNLAHRKAAEILKQNKFSSYKIIENGALEKIEDIYQHLTHQSLDSDNIVFKFEG